MIDNMEKYFLSEVNLEGTTYCLVIDPQTKKKYLAISGDLQGFQTLHTETSGNLCELTHENVLNLQKRLPWLKAVPLQLATSAGMGDRLGLATPGHAMAAESTGISPIFAQQSVRENARTGRTPQEVMDDAVWGLFQVGWKAPWGGDADHLKRLEDLPGFVDAGFTFFTVDPGDFVDQTADEEDLAYLRKKATELPWMELKTTVDEMMANFTHHAFKLESLVISFTEETLLRAAVKYGRAVLHAVRMYAQLKLLKNGQDFDFEVSVDETATPTSIAEHFYIAHELKRLGVRWTSLAPRFVGRFEKGVDYIGDLAELDLSMGQHTEVMRHFGNYKISLHSGSDKFSVYPIAARHAKGLVHLKTAGTSYLEALRVIAMVDPVLFREIYQFSRSRYLIDQASYHVSASLERTPENPLDNELPGLLDQFDARQVLHVTFGSVLDHFRPVIFDRLRKNEQLYYQVLQRHFRRHLDPLRI